MHEASRNASWDRCWGRAGQLLANFFFTRPSTFHAHTMQAKAWFSLAYKHKGKDTHAQSGKFDSILDTSSPQPNDKQDGGRSVRHIAFDMFA